MGKVKKNIEESWKDVILSLGKSEMMHVAYDPEQYAPEIVAMAKDGLKQKFGMTDEDVQAIPKPEHVIVEEPMTRDLLIDLLKGMGCSIEFLNDEYEDDGSCIMSFTYMGESFYAGAKNDNIYVDFDKSCGYCNLADEEEVARVKEAINRVNDLKRDKMYYMEDKAIGWLFVSCCIEFTLIPLIPMIESYVHNQLKSILNVEKYYKNILEDLKTRKDLHESRAKDYKLRAMKKQLCEDRDNTTKKVKRVKSEITGSRDLLLDTLTSMGCPYQIDDDDDSICFEYHGDDFYAEADNEHPYVSLYYYAWTGIDLEDAEDISETVALRNAINEANWKNRVITVYSIDEEEKKMNVHGRTEILFIPDIPDIKDYLEAELSRFYRAEHSVTSELS